MTTDQNTMKSRRTSINSCFFLLNFSKPYCLFLLIHSIKRKNIININKPDGNISKFSKSDGENIVAKYDVACPIFSALKNIQAKTVKIKVKNINKNSFILGSNFPFATVSKLFRLLFVNNSGRK